MCFKGSVFNELSEKNPPQAQQGDGKVQSSVDQCGLEGARSRTSVDLVREKQEGLYLGHSNVEGSPEDEEL